MAKKIGARRASGGAKAAKGRTGAKKTGNAARRAPSRASSLKGFCRTLQGTTEDVKWGDDLIFSVGGKMYAGFDVEGEAAFGFKCDDDDFDRLTEREGIVPAPYAARFGWVLVERRSALSDAEAKALLRKAHAVVAGKLPRRVRVELGLTGEG